MAPWNRTPDVKGRRVTLEVAIENGRIEDVLKLALRTSEPMMTGRVQLKTTFPPPAGEAD